MAIYNINFGNFGQNKESWYLGKPNEQFKFKFPKIDTIKTSPAFLPQNMLDEKVSIGDNTPKISLVQDNMLSKSFTLQDVTKPSTSEPKAISKGKLGANATGAIIGAAGAVTDLAGTAILENKRKDDYANGYGILYHDNNTDYKENRLKSTTKYMGTGAAIGSIAGPVGTLIGAGVGAVAGLFLGKKKAKKERDIANENYINNTFNAAADYTRSSYANQLATMAKEGMKIRITRDIESGKKAVLKDGMTKNLIPSGVLHAHKNSIGDKGIPVVKKDGTKVLEIEKEEIILTKDVTDKIEGYIKKYKSTKDDEYLIKLGELAAKELLCNTTDNTDKFVDKEETCNIK